MMMMMVTCPNMICGVQMIKLMITTRIQLITSPTTDQHQEARNRDHAVAPPPVHLGQGVEAGEKDLGAEVRKSLLEDQDHPQLHHHPVVPDPEAEENVNMEKTAVQNHVQGPAVVAKSGHVHLPVVTKNGLGAHGHQVPVAAEVDRHLGIGQERGAELTNNKHMQKHSKYHYTLQS